MTSQKMPAEERRARALELHLAGAKYDAIAEQLQYASRSGAFKAVQTALKDREVPVASDDDDLDTKTELARLDAMLTGLWPKARRGDVQAVDRVLKIEDRREQIRLRSRPMDAPTQDAGDQLEARAAAKLRLVQ